MKKFDISYYTDKFKIIAGVDEAGRGPLAGPVVAAAVIFPKDCFIPGVNDSKKLTVAKREFYEKLIKEKALSYGYGVVYEKEIDKINILQASLKAMKIAVSNLSIKPDLILIDGNKVFKSKIMALAIVKGDAKSFSIAAASILAKVKRDKIMTNAAKKYPEYFWEKNKGYGTKQHIEAIKINGLTKMHRKTFLTKITEKHSQEKLF